jgi:hypothetical protein
VSAQTVAVVGQSGTTPDRFTANLCDPLTKAAVGATVLIRPYTTDQQQAAIEGFIGGCIAEIHAAAAE